MGGTVMRQMTYRLVLVVLLFTACNTTYGVGLPDSPRLDRRFLERCLELQGLRREPIESYLHDDQPYPGDAIDRFMGDYFQASVWLRDEKWHIRFLPWLGGAAKARASSESFSECVREQDASLEISVEAERFLDLR